MRRQPPLDHSAALITACLIVIAIMCVVAVAGIVLLPPTP